MTQTELAVLKKMHRDLGELIANAVRENDPPQVKPQASEPPPPKPPTD